LQSSEGYARKGNLAHPQPLFRGGKPMCAYHCRNPIFCILPGFILKSVIEKGTPEQRQAALATLSSDSTFRAMRAFLSASNPRSARRRRRIGARACQAADNLDRQESRNATRKNDPRRRHADSRRRCGR
jgi:hypothetical protein